MTLIRKLILGGVGVVGALGFAAQPLVAAADNELIGYDAAAFVGNATLGPGTCGGVCWVGGTGSYAFASTTCVGISDPNTDVTPPDPEAAIPCSINSTGTYVNIVCGTGTIAGTATISEGGADPSSATATYTGVIVASVGVLTASVTESDSPGTFTGVSVVQLSAVPLAPNPFDMTNFGECTPNFGILGVFASTS